MDYIIGQKPAGNPAAQAGARGPQPAASASAAIMDGDQRTFMQDVIEASRSLPVLVDFWATWCGPCKQLTPALERVTIAAGGRMRLVKIDIDKNKPLVAQLTQLGLPLQSVPTVAAFYQGQIVDVFQGALPESEIKRFVENLLKMAGGSLPEADLLAQARADLEAKKFGEAADGFAALLNQDAENGDAWGGLVRTLLAMGDIDQAQDALAQIPGKLANHPEIAGARSAVELALQGKEAAGQIGALERRVAANPQDHEARYELAAALNAAGKRPEAADALLHIVKTDRSWREDGARQQLLKFFEAWGLTDPVTLAARRKLSALLFS